MFGTSVPWAGNLTLEYRLQTAIFGYYFRVNTFIYKFVIKFISLVGVSDMFVCLVNFISLCALVCISVSVFACFICCFGMISKYIIAEKMNYLLYVI